ncbi:hypothetical protein BAY1663_02865 [Pseudomonas sp. BAY1663]|nr:hypothetical protein BAY1663_02865 [Pseudomonas sp. BAY1663]
MDRKRIVALRRLKPAHLQRLREAFEVTYFEEPQHQPEAVGAALCRAHG